MTPGVFALLSSLVIHGCAPVSRGLPVWFSSVASLDPSIQLDMRYFSANNFLGRAVAGYLGNACVLTTPAAQALAEAQRTANARGYSLKVYDCYRPQRAVDDFVTWAADPTDVKMQAHYYPDVPKDELFTRGYIAERSGHSRGSTVDLTLVPLGSMQPATAGPGVQHDCRGIVAPRYPDNSIEMGTGYDCFDTLSHTDNPAAGEEALANRRLLREFMEAAGFANYEQEWWHYTLRDEAFPDEFFDFPVTQPKSSMP